MLVTLLGFELKRASATSLVVIVVTATAGAIGFELHGGVVWLAALPLAIGSTLGSYVGARLMKIIPSRILTFGFAALLTGVGLRLMFNTGAGGTGQAVLSTPALFGLLALGLAAGLLAGLLGVGGAQVIMPILILVFGLTSVEAKGTSLVMMIPAGLIGTFVNFKNGYVDIRSGVIIGAVAATVSYGGVLIAVSIPTVVSNILLALLLLYTAVQFFIRAIRATKAVDR